MTRRMLMSAIAAMSLWYVGCTPTRTITYDVRDIGAAAKLSSTFEQTGNIVLDIEAFEDGREAIAENNPLFVRSRETNIDDKDFCINAEEHYKKATVPAQVATVMAEHMKRRGGFKRVLSLQKDAAEYYVTGNIRRLYGAQEVSTSAKVGASFGLIGAIATAGAKTQGTVAIEFTDVTVIRRKDGASRKIGPITESYAGELSADAYCWAIYEHVNDYLKSAVSKLAVEVEKSVAGMERPDSLSSTQAPVGK